MKKLLITMMAVMLLVGCDGEQADDTETNQGPVTDNSQTDCRETHEYNEVSEPKDEDSGKDESTQASSEPEGCELSPICKAVAKFQSEGYVVEKVSSKNGKIIIDVNTCGGDSNININSGNTTNPPQ